MTTNSVDARKRRRSIFEENDDDYALFLQRQQRHDVVDSVPTTNENVLFSNASDALFVVKSSQSTTLNAASEIDDDLMTIALLTTDLERVLILVFF